MKITNKRSYAKSIGGVRAQPGETVDVPDEVGNAALEQPDSWAKPAPPKPKPADDGEKES